MVIGGVSEGDRNVHSASLQPSMTKLPVQWSGKAHMPSGELIYSATKHGWSIAVGFVYVSYIQNKGACPPQKYDWIKIYIKQQKLCPALKWYHLSTSLNVLNTIYWDCQIHSIHWNINFMEFCGQDPGSWLSIISPLRRAWGGQKQNTGIDVQLKYIPNGKSAAGEGPGISLHG